MSRSILIALILSAGLVPAQAAWAQTKPAGQADPTAAAFKAWDKNSDGQLSLVEFRAGWEQTQAAARTQMALRKQFATIDANHDGGLDATEYANLVLIKQAGKAAPPLARFDANGNAKLEFPEYVKLVEALAAKPDAKK